MRTALLVCLVAAALGLFWRVLAPPAPPAAAPYRHAPLAAVEPPLATAPTSPPTSRRYMEMRERPLFHETRRPPAVTPQSTEDRASPVEKSPALIAPAAPIDPFAELRDAVLVAIVVVDGDRVAFFRRPDATATLTALRVGDVFHDASVVEISPTAVDFTKAGRRHRHALRPLGGAATR